MAIESGEEVPGSVRVSLTVSQLNRAVASSLQRTFGMQRVRGEIATLTRAASGHWYFSLKDASAQVRCVMFRSRNSLVDFAPREGDAVEVTAALALYEPRGDFQLTVESLRRVGAGRLWEEFLRLRQRLLAEGLFDAAIKRALPRLPQRVGVITSLQAAALRDVLTTLQRRAPYLQVIVYPVPVQGSEAGARIAAMLARAAARAEVDVLLLVRGGGSIEDLWAFNEEQVARAIRAVALPVIVGVGHESDVTIADFAADVRAPTPTAAAELVAPEAAALVREIAQRLRAMARECHRVLALRSQRVDTAGRILGAPRAPLRGLDARVRELRLRCALQAADRQQRAARAWSDLVQALRRARPEPQRSAAQLAALVARLRAAQARNALAWTRAVEHAARALEHLNVQAVLDRGYSILRDDSGRIVSDGGALPLGAVLSAQLARGGAALRVEQAHRADADPERGLHNP